MLLSRSNLTTETRRTATAAACATGIEDDSKISFIDRGNGRFEGELLIKDDKTLQVLAQMPISAKRINAKGQRR